MFIGHYGAALAAKRLSPRVSLGALFVAVQFLDVLFGAFVLLGVEKLRIVHGYTAYNPYDLYWMPYSHSLAGSLLWSAGVAALAWVVLRWPARERRLAALALGLAVFSHFVFDVPVHTPDLPLGFAAASPKIGLGLWNHRYVAIALELVALGAGAFAYLRATRLRTGLAVFGAVLVVLAVATPFMPDPPGDRAFAVQALASYVVLAVVAHLVDRRFNA